MEESAEAVVVGGGPAGLAAATWLARYRRSVVVLDSGEYRNRSVERVQGYLGSDPISPDELRGRAREQLRRYERVRMIETRATAASRPEDRFRVTTQHGEVVGRRLIIATGVEDEF